MLILPFLLFQVKHPLLIRSLLFPDNLPAFCSPLFGRLAEQLYSTWRILRMSPSNSKSRAKAAVSEFVVNELNIYLMSLPMLLENIQNCIGILTAHLAWQNQGNIYPRFLLKLRGCQSIGYEFSHGVFFRWMMTSDGADTSVK